MKGNELISLMTHSPTIFARRVEVIEQNGRQSLRLTMPRNFLYGMSDGQNLFGTALDLSEDLDSDDPRVLDLIILEDDGKLTHQEKAQLSETLNTTLSQKQYSLFNFLNRFEWIKDALQGTKWENYWRFKENGTGKESVETLLKLLISLDGKGQKIFEGAEIYNNRVYKDLLSEHPQALDPFANLLIDLHTVIWMIRKDSYPLLGEKYSYNMDASERRMFSVSSNVLNDTLVAMILYSLRDIVVMGDDGFYAWHPVFKNFDAVQTYLAKTLPPLLAEIRNRPTEEIDPRSYARSQIEKDRYKLWKATQVKRKALRVASEDDVPEFKPGKTNWDKLADKASILFSKYAARHGAK